VRMQADAQWIKIWPFIVRWPFLDFHGKPPARGTSLTSGYTSVAGQ
jgi:hypothetical protein